ncbi:hypothetical protein GCM10025767_14860 [Thalassotalea piscium]|uniref:Plasmid stabilization system protein ParE n=1 Tax=Thalassotalea piscium TaxID=1230533 RepID=A0A7X0TSX4_9GAMM|nr:plasmid stabilization system protein ParE [Thalassotalea piscium]
MIFWEDESLNDREKIFEFLFDFNPSAAEKTEFSTGVRRQLTPH